MHNIDLGSLPDWSEFRNILKEGPSNCLDRINSLDGSLLPSPDLVIPQVHDLKFNDGQLSPFSFELRISECLLDVLTKIPIVQLDVKSFSVYASYLLNLEK